MLGKQQEWRAACHVDQEPDDMGSRTRAANEGPLKSGRRISAHSLRPTPINDGVREARQKQITVQPDNADEWIIQLSPGEPFFARAQR